MILTILGLLFLVLWALIALASFSPIDEYDAMFTGTSVAPEDK